MSEPTSLQSVHLLELPVPLAAKTQQHFEELMREFALIAAGRTDDADHHFPARLMRLVDDLVRQFNGVTGDAEQRLADAIDNGQSVIDDHLLEIPAVPSPMSASIQPRRTLHIVRAAVFVLLPHRPSS